jgi:hypothetical protein
MTRTLVAGVSLDAGANDDALDPNGAALTATSAGATGSSTAPSTSALKQ